MKIVDKLVKSSGKKDLNASFNKLKNSLYMNSIYKIIKVIKKNMIYNSQIWVF